MAPPARSGARDQPAQAELDALGLERLAEAARQLGVVAAQDAVVPVDDRHVRAEPVQRLRHLHPDGPGAEHRQPVGPRAELEERLVGERVNVGQALDGRDDGAPAGRDHDAAGRHAAGAALALDHHLARAHKPRPPGRDLDAEPADPLGRVGLVVDRLADPAEPAHGVGEEGGAERVGVRRLGRLAVAASGRERVGGQDGPGGPGAGGVVQERLRGDAAGPGAVAAQPVALHKERLGAEVDADAGGREAGGAAAQDEEVVVGSGHGYGGRVSLQTGSRRTPRLWRSCGARARLAACAAIPAESAARARHRGQGSARAGRPAARDWALTQPPNAMRLVPALALLAPLALAACGAETEPAADPPPAVAAAPTTPTASPAEMEPAMPTEPVADADMADAEVVSQGTFRSGDGHAVSGRAVLYRLADGSHTVRLEGLDSDNGPDLRVWLVSDLADKADGSVDLGALKSTRGDQNYPVPTGADVSGAAGVSVWCRAFSVEFGTAPLG